MALDNIIASSWANIWGGGALLAILGAILSPLVRWLWEKYKRQDRAIETLENDFFIKPTTAEPKESDKLLELKAGLYSGGPHAQFDPELSVERSLASDIRSLVKEQKVSFLHIHIYCKNSGQGVSQLLKALHVIFSNEEPAIILRAKDFSAYSRTYNITTIKNLKHFWKSSHVYLLLDNAFSGDDKSIIDRENGFIEQLKSSVVNKRLKITVVSGNHSEQAPLGSTPMKLELTESDERKIFNRIFKERPLLVKNFSGEIDTFWGWAGKEEYEDDLRLFLALLYKFAYENNCHTEDKWEICFAIPNDLKNIDVQKRGLITIVAAYSILGLSLRDEILHRFCGRAGYGRDNLSWLEKLPWIVLEEPKQKSFKLRPGQARVVLGMYSINSVNEFMTAFKSAFNWDDGLINWPDSERELLRHLFRRLNDTRYQRLNVDDKLIDGTIEGTKISTLLYAEIKDKVLVYLNTCDDIGVVTSWANTAGRIDGNLMGVLINRAIGLGGGQKIEKAEHFVAFGSALSKYVGAKEKNYQTHLIGMGLDIMDYEAALEDAKRYDNRRMNEVITNWFRLLDEVNPSEAENVITKNFDILDSRAFATVALSINMRGYKLRLLELAREKSLEPEMIWRYPSNAIKQILAYMKQTQYVYDKFLADIKQLVIIVGDPNKSRFDPKDIKKVKEAAEKALAQKSGVVDEDLQHKLEEFLQRFENDRTR